MNPDYENLLEFLYKYNYDYAKKVLDDNYTMYLDKVHEGIYQCFASRLKVKLMATPTNRISRIKQFFDRAEKYLQGKKAPDHYWATIYQSMKRVISECHPGYFAGCYIESFAENLQSEENIRYWIKQVYSDWLNKTQNKELYEKAIQFITLVNECIDKYQTYPDISDEVKKLLLQKKLKMYSETTIKQSIVLETTG